MNADVFPAASRALTWYWNRPVSRSVNDVATVVATDTKGPLLVARKTSYPVTPTSSVDAVHVSVTTRVQATIARSPVGTVGELVSAAAAPGAAGPRAATSGAVAESAGPASAPPTDNPTPAIMRR